VELRVRQTRTTDAGVEVDLDAEVRPGPLVRLGETRFEGGSSSRTNWLHRLGHVDGPLLDIVAVEAARERLARRGVFSYVGVRYDPPEGDERDVVYELTEGRRVDVSLFAGYGSYDLLFGGVEWNQFNLWGVGHQTRLRAMQSFKTSNAVFTYAIPEVLVSGLGVYANVDALRREEITFDREELKLGVGGRQTIEDTGLQFGLRYSYEFLDAQQPVTATNVAPAGLTRVGAVIFEGQWDRRDNPLSPRSGHRIYAVVEAADPALGGDAAYQLVEVGASLHVPLYRGLVAHANVQHAVAFADNSATDLPFNKRFFPGGDNSVRGYQRGEASPLDSSGSQIGAETYLQGNLELEQYLTGSWSLVAFVDTVGITPALMDYPADEWLLSVGGGIRWNSIIGPVRLEYGHNLNPRTFDPRGTLHLSIGFPF
jgi:outer membrane protein assembly factor BamA